MAVKTHLEVVSNLSTKFLNALKQFSSCRGRPSDIQDSWTTFVGTNRKLKEFYNFTIFFDSPWDQLTLHWVKSVKFHLKRVLTNMILMYAHILIESCLNVNSRVNNQKTPKSGDGISNPHSLKSLLYTTLGPISNFHRNVKENHFV